MEIARLVGRALRSVLPYLSFDSKIRLAETILQDCGFGAGADIGHSNEEVIFEFLENTRPVLVDVGAHCGEYTLLFLRHFPAGRAFCFEPVQAHFEILQHATEGLDGVKLFNLALGNSETSALIYRDQQLSGLASLTKRRLDHFSISMDIQEEVKVATLDSVLGNGAVEYIDLLKLDVEGHDLEVLKGAQNLLSANRIGAVQFEFGGSNLDTRTNLQDFYYFMTSNCFRIYVVTKYGLEPIQQYREIYEQYRTTNFVAFRTQ